MELACPYCGQAEITFDWWCRDLNGDDILRIVCEHCRATWIRYGGATTTLPRSAVD